MIEITATSGTKVAFDQGLLWIENDNRKTIALSKSEARSLVSAIMEWCKLDDRLRYYVEREIDYPGRPNEKEWAYAKNLQLDSANFIVEMRREIEGLRKQLAEAKHK